MKVVFPDISDGAAYACRLRRTRNHAPMRARIPITPRATATPIPAFAPLPSPDDAGGAVELVAEALEVDEEEDEEVEAAVGLGFGTI